MAKSEHSFCQSFTKYPPRLAINLRKELLAAGLISDAVTIKGSLHNLYFNKIS